MTPLHSLGLESRRAFHTGLLAEANKLHWLERQQVAAQHTPSAPVPPRRELHLYRLCRTA
jgi:hypothetical protein